MQVNGVSQQSFVDQWAQSTGRRLLRDGVGQGLDAMVKLEMPKMAAYASKVDSFVPKALSYARLFNSTDYIVDTTAGLDAMKYAAKENIFSLSKPTVSFSDYLKRTVYAENVKAITRPLKKGLVFTGLAKLLNAGVTMAGVAQKTKDSFSQTQSVASAAITFGKESAKALVAWELGSLGFTLGTLLLPVGWLSLVSGAVFMGLFSTLSSRLLDKLA